MSESDGIELACPKCKALLSVPTTVAGTQVPCPDCSEPIDVPVQTGIQKEPRWGWPKSAPYEDDEDLAPELAARRAMEQRIRELQERARKGANWFFWVAALSVVNSVVMHLGGTFYFVVGLGITLFTDAIAVGIGQEIAAARFAAIGFAVIVALIVAGFGLAAREGYRFFFALGMLLYLLDGLLFLFVQDIISMAFHAWALYWMWNGFSALREIRRIEEE